MIGSNFAYYALSVTDASTKFEMFSADAFAKAAEVTILGMLMVFSVLALLWGVLAIFKLIFVGGTSKKKKPEVKAENRAEAAEAPEAAVTVDEDDNTELVAIITAAIAAYRENEGYSGSDVNGFRVVSFKRANAGRAWNSKK